MKLILAFTVPGVAVSQGSMAHNQAGKLYQKPQVVLWREKVAQEAHIVARQQGLELPLDGPVHVHVDFYLRKPKRPKFEVPATALDLDKLQRAIGDALSPKHGPKILINDNRITRWVAEKHYAYPGHECTHIKIRGT